MTREPFNLSFEQIARLTDYQIGDILFQPLPEDKPAKKPVGPDLYAHCLEGLPEDNPAKRRFWYVWRVRGIPDEEIAAKWQQQPPDRP